jgi:hypothetical protein
MSFLVSGDDLRRDPEHLFDPVGELLCVLGVPGGAGGHHLDSLRPRLVDKVRVLAQRADRPAQGRFRRAAGPVPALPETDDLYLADYLSQPRPFGINTRD